MALQYGIYSYWSQTYWGGMVAALGGALVFGAARRHAKHCACREMPETIAREIRKRGYAKARSPYDLGKRAVIIGSVDAAADLSTNARHFIGFGKNRRTP